MLFRASFIEYSVLRGISRTFALMLILPLRHWRHIPEYLKATEEKAAAADSLFRCLWSATTPPPSEFRSMVELTNLVDPTPFLRSMFSRIFFMVNPSAEDWFKQKPLADKLEVREEYTREMSRLCANLGERWEEVLKDWQFGVVVSFFDGLSEEEWKEIASLLRGGAVSEPIKSILLEVLPPFIEESPGKKEMILKHLQDLLSP